jgi:hypothetical protein
LKPLVYIAAPYTHPDPVANTHRAMAVWSELHATGLVVPLCPHWSMLQHLYQPLPYEAWLDYSLELVRRSDAVLRVAGLSDGADRETAEARFNSIPVFANHAALLGWAKAWSPAR